MLRAFLFGVMMVLALGVGGCDDEDVIKAAAAKGIFLQKKQVEDPPGSGKLIEKYVVVQDPAQDKINNALRTAQDYAGGVPIAGQIIGGLFLLSSLGGNLLMKKLKEIADKKNAELAAENEQHEKTHDATSLALQNFVNASPPEVGKALVEHIDSVHDHMEIPAEHQDWLQPSLKAT